MRQYVVHCQPVQMGFWLAVVWMGGLAALLGAWQPAQAQATPLCRLGLNVFGTTWTYELQPLRISWFIDAIVQPHGGTPVGLQHLPTIQLTQADVDDFSYWPSGAVLDAAIAADPGATWLIGNCLLYTSPSPRD